MTTISANLARSQEVLSADQIGPGHDKVGPGMAKAVGSSDLAGLGLPWNQAQGDLIIRYYGSVKAAAFALGQVDPSLMQREFRDGKFGRFNDRSDERAKAYVANGLAEIFGVVPTREARIVQLQRVVVDSLQEIVQLAVSA